MPVDTPDFFEALKALASQQDWVDLGNGQFQILHPLDDLHGATIEGAQLRVTAFDELPEQAVTVLLEYPQTGQRGSAVDRIDWRPIHTHYNENKGPEEYRLMTIAGTHHHSFELNWLPDERRLRSGNLPIAKPLNPEPESFQYLLEFAAKCFRINDISAIEPPPWEETLFSKPP